MNIYLIRARCVLHALQSSSMCQRGCCWTPFGHSGAAEGCHCHDLDEFTLFALVRQKLITEAMTARPGTPTRSTYLTAEDVA